MNSALPFHRVTEPERIALPEDLEAEASFLGAILFDGTILDTLQPMPCAADFHHPAHQQIFGKICELRAAGKNVNPITIRPLLEGCPDLRELGGTSYLARLTGNPEGLLVPRELAERIIDLGARRRRLEWLASEAEFCRNLGQPLADIVLPEAIRAPSAPIAALDLAALALREPEPKRFILPRIAPTAEVTLFTGAGAVGKSLLAQQFATALAAGLPTLGLDLHQCPAIYLTCEDDAEQLHWRQVHICKALGISLAALSGVLHLVSLRGEPDNALAHFLADGRLVPAPLFTRLSAFIRSTRARLVALDNVAHLFTGNENDRGQVTAFVNLLNRTAGESGAAILLLGHPNKAGDSYSGSTAWLNAVRSQVSMTRPNGEAADQDMRTLVIGKPNYSRAGEAMSFRWHEWAFVREQDLAPEYIAELSETIATTGANDAFLRCLRIRAGQPGREVGPKIGPSYAPTRFAEMPEAKGYGKESLKQAMERLLSIGLIVSEEVFNPKSKRHATIIREAN